METTQTKKPIELLVASTGLRLKQFTIKDAQAIFDLIDLNREHLSQHNEPTSTNYPTVQSVEESIIKPKNEDRLRFGIWDDGVLVGSINLTPDTDNKRRGEVGYYLGSKFTGKGYILKAITILTEFAFKNLNYDEIYGKVHVNNIASQKTLLKSGFTETVEYTDEKTNAKGIMFTLKKS